MTITDNGLGIDFDPWADEHFEDPISVYDRMREVEPIHWNEKRGLWFVSTFDEVDQILKDRHHFVAGPFQASRPHMERAKKEQAREFAGGTMLTNEAPDHPRLRRPVMPAFAPKALKNLESTIQEITDELLDAVDGSEEWDFIQQFANPLPVRVVAALLGIPSQFEEELLTLGRAGEALLAIDPRASQETLNSYGSMGKGIEQLVLRIVAAKREMPREDDLISSLLDEQENGRFSEGEVLATVHLMIEAGHVTTVNLLGNSINLLLEDRSRYTWITQHPDDTRAAVDECLRMDGPVHFAGRITSEAVTIQGHDFKVGDVVMLMFTAANRDPIQFHDPATFDVSRSPNPVTNFGAGIHRCIGANLALAEADVAFRRITSRFPGLRLVRPPVRQRTFELRGFSELIVAND